MFRRQLVQLFATQYPQVVQGTANDQPAALASIKLWLTRNPTCWLLVVEDANLECCSLWDCLPPAGTGRVILTSIADLRGQAPHGGGLAASAVAPLGITATVELAPLTTADSLDMWRQMKLFALTVPQVDMTISESDLEAQCVAATPPVVFVPPPTTEKSKAKKQRHRDLQMALREHRELSTPGLAEFLEEQLGNLPLTVALCGQMLRADDRLESVADLIALFPQLGAA